MSNDVDQAVVETPQPQLPAVILFLLLSSVLFLCLVRDADDGLERTLCDVLCVCVCALNLSLACGDENKGAAKSPFIFSPPSLPPKLPHSF